MKDEELGQVVEVFVPGLQGRHYRVYYALGTRLAAFVTVSGDGNAWCPDCRAGHCAHVDQVVASLCKAEAFTRPAPLPMARPTTA